MAKLNIGTMSILKEAIRYLAVSPQSYLRQRQALRALDDRLLADIGITHGEARSGRPDVRAPDPGTMDSGTPYLRDAIVIRDVLESDMPAIRSIYAHEVLHGLASFEESPPTIAELNARRENILRLGLPYLAAEVNGRVLGFSYANTYRPRPAYRHTVEDSVYVAQGMHGLGIGRALLTALIARCEQGQWRQMVAIIGNAGNTGSIALHRRLGFRHTGTLESIGFKLGQWVDTVIMQRELGCGSAAPPTSGGHAGAGM